MAQTRRRQRGAGGCISKPGEPNVCVENPIATVPPVAPRKTKAEVIAKIKNDMLRIGTRINQSKKNRNELRERGRTAYLAGNRMGAKSMLVRSKMREKVIDQNLRSQQLYRTLLTRLGNKKGGDPTTLNPLHRVAAPSTATKPVAAPVTTSVPVNVSTRNPLHVAAQTKTLRETINSQIATAEAKLEEVKKAIQGLPEVGTPAEIPTLRNALVKTVEIYNKQIADLKARRPTGGKR